MTHYKQSNADLHCLPSKYDITWFACFENFADVKCIVCCFGTVKVNTYQSRIIESDWSKDGKTKTSSLNQLKDSSFQGEKIF